MLAIAVKVKVKLYHVDFFCSINFQLNEHNTNKYLIFIMIISIRKEKKLTEIKSNNKLSFPFDTLRLNHA